MIAKIGQCQRCMGMIYLAEEVGLRWTADLEPLDAQKAVQALMVGREVYRVTQPGPRLQTAKPDVLRALREAEPGERPVVVASHPCPTGAAKAFKPVLPASQEPGQGNPQGAHPKASVAPSRPSSGPSTTSSTRPTARDAARQASDGPRCDGCGQPCADGTYASIALGDLVQWAHHVTTCGG